MRVAVLGLGAMVLVAAGCGSATAPTPTQLTDTFTGTLPPLGTDFTTFTIVYTQAFFVTFLGTPGMQPAKIHLGPSSSFIYIGYGP